MHAELTFQLATLYAFLLALARVSGVIVFVPIPGLSAGPDVSRVVLALALTALLYPAWPKFSGTDATGFSIGGFAAGIVSESFFGLILGVAVAFLLEGMQLAAQIIGLQAGYSYASTVDPTTQADTTTLQLMAQLLAGTLFFALGFDRQVLWTLGRSFQTPARHWFVAAGSTTEPLIRLGATIFTTGVQLALPVIALMVLLDVAFAVLGRLHAQLQLLSLSFAVKMLTALVFLTGLLSMYPAVFNRAGNTTFAVLNRLLNP